MGSRDQDQTTAYHQPLLSSLVVRASDSDGGGGGADYEPGEVRRDPPPYSRSGRYSGDPGYRIRANSGSPVRRRGTDHQYGSDFDHSGGVPRNRGVGNGGSPGRYRAISPPYGRGRGRGGDKPFSRNFDGAGLGRGNVRGENQTRSTPNVRPREGDWFCPDPLCGNLNFARREYCNTCKKHRQGPGIGGSPRRGYSGPPPPPSHLPPRRFSGPTFDRSPPGRPMNGGYRSPPRIWPRDGLRDHGPRDFDGHRDFDGIGPFHSRHHEGRFPDHHLPRERPDYHEENFRERIKFDRPIAQDWGRGQGMRDRGRVDFFYDRKGFERRPLSPPPLGPPHLGQRSRWPPRDVRERSRSPIRGGFSPKDYRRDMYMDRGRGRDDRYGMGRGGY